MAGANSLPPSRSSNADAYPLVAVMGPTASGKSDLALAIAEQFGGEIINYDSVQVYRGFNIGTAKLPLHERRRIPHYGVDIVEPGAVFTAGDYARTARSILDELRERHRLPVLVGGTGLYLRALIDGLFQGPERDEDLRQRLEQRAAQRPAGYLHRLLERLDRKASGRIHPNDTPKLIRAIEVCLKGKLPMSELWGQGRNALEGYCPLRIGLDPPRAALYERIERRAARMFEQGLIEETRGLLSDGVPRSARPFSALGYREVLDHLDGKLTRDEAIELTARMTRRYAKRQMTWFRREPAVQWFAGFGNEEEIQEQVAEWVRGELAVW